MNLGEKLKYLRINAKNTLKEQSELLGVSLNTVYRWEHDLATPRKPMLKTIADHYNMPLERLLSESTEENKLEHITIPMVSNAEQQLLSMFRKLSNNSKYKVLGYIEHLFIDEYRATSP